MVNKMREMKNSGIEWIGEIPTEWEITTIKKAYTFQTGWTPDTKKEDNFIGDNVWVNISDMNSKVIFDSNKHISDDAVAISSMNISPKGSLLYSFKLSVGNVAFCGVDLYTNEAIATFLEGENSLKYLYYIAPVFIIKNANENIYGAKLLNQSLIRNAKIVLPPLSEQHRIADFLDEKCAKIDAVIEKQKQVIEKLKEYKLSVITEAVTKGLDPTVPMKDSGVEWIGEIPEKWNIGKIKSSVLKVGSGKTPKGGSEIYTDEGVLFIRSQNVYDEGLKLDNSTYISSDIDNEMSNTRVYSNDVLLNITGGSIGRTCIYPQGMTHANVNQHVCIIRTKENVIKPEYMHYFWMSYCGKTSIDIFQTGANREGLNFEQINNTRIPYISLNEQEEIITYLDNRCVIIDSSISKKQTIIEKLTEYKKSLIYEVVTGKKEV